MTEAGKQYVQAEESGSDSDSERLRGMFRRVKEEYEKLKTAYLQLRDKSEAEGSANKILIARLSEDVNQMKQELDSHRTLKISTAKKLEGWSAWFEKAYAPSMSEISSRVSSLKHDWQITLETTQKLQELSRSLYEWRAPQTAPARKISEQISDLASETESEISRFQRLLRGRFGSLERAWRSHLNPRLKPKIPSVEFFRKVRELGYEGDMRKLWQSLSVGNFLTFERLATPTSLCVRNFRSRLQKLGHGSVTDGWKLYFESETGVFALPDFVQVVVKRFPDISAQEAEEIFSSLALDGIFTIEDLDAKAFAGVETGSPEIFDPVLFLQQLEAKYGSLGRAWIWLFEGQKVGNFLSFAHTVRTAGFTGSPKRLWTLMGGKATLEVLDPKISKLIFDLRNRLTVDVWFEKHFDGSFLLTKDEFIGRCQDAFPEIFSFDDLAAIFEFLDYEDSGFVTIEDIDRDAIGKISARANLTRAYKDCAERFSRASALKKLGVGQSRNFRHFLTGILGNRIRTWIHGFGAAVEELDFPGFLGAVRGLGWKGRVKSTWVYHFSLKKDERIDLAKFSETSEGGLVKSFFQSMIVKHDTIARAWKLVLNAHEVGFITKEKFARLCARGDVAEPFNEAQGILIFDLLDFSASGKLYLDDLGIN